MGSLSWNLFTHIHHKNEVAFYKIKKLPLRNPPSTTNDAEANFHCLPKDHTRHEEKKEWDKRSRSFRQS